MSDPEVLQLRDSFRNILLGQLDTSFRSSKDVSKPFAPDISRIFAPHLTQKNGEQVLLPQGFSAAIQENPAFKTAYAGPQVRRDTEFDDFC